MLTWTAFNQMNSNYWSYFLTEICGLEPTVMGTVKAVTGVGEWFFVIIAAIIIERVWLKHGQYRSWLLVAPPATFVCLLMTFVDPVFLSLIHISRLGRARPPMRGSAGFGYIVFYRVRYAIESTFSRFEAACADLSL